MGTRLFIALIPHATVCDQLACWRDAWTWTRAASPVKTGRLHVTLHFLGDVAQERISELTAALDVPFVPFTLRLTRAALWPHGIAVLESDAVPDELFALHASLGAVVRGQGLRVDERPYRPHVTLARRANGAAMASIPTEIDWQVSGYALMASTLGKDGAYTVLHQYPD